MAMPRQLKPDMKGTRSVTAEREKRMAEAAKLEMLGYDQHEIAGKLGVSQQQICEDLRLVKRRWQVQAVEHRQAMVVEKLHMLKLVRREAYEAWEACKNGSVTTHRECMTPDDEK